MSGSGSGLKKFMVPDPDPVCPERLDSDSDPDLVNIRPDPQPYDGRMILVLIVSSSVLIGSESSLLARLQSVGWSRWSVIIPLNGARSFTSMPQRSTRSNHS